MAWDNLAAGKWAYKRGLHDLGAGCYAWLQPDGGWGWSNAGLVVDGDQSLLVDTLYDLPLTRTMLDAMADAEPTAAKAIDTLVNTHANGDHCYGNELVTGAEIIASKASAAEMEEVPPGMMAAWVESAESMPAPFGPWLQASFGQFEFAEITLTPPTREFEGHLTQYVGDKRIELIEVGPAHTRGDVLVYVPEDKTVFTGDILFIEGTPIMWEGPVNNWIAACDRIAEMDVDTVVPGHGPITDKRGPAAVKAYLEYISAEARARYEAGLSVEEAARDIALSDFSSWGDSERIVINVDTLYREFAGDDSGRNIPQLFMWMSELATS